jgi:hypothetical protein
MAHWRDHLDSTLMGAYSLYDSQTDRFKSVEGYIVRCTDETHTLGASGKKKVFVAYTSIDAKPMKINVSIANEIALSAKTHNPEKWVNIPVTFYVNEKVSTKEGIVPALRVRARIEQHTKPAEPLQADIVEQVSNCTTLTELGEIWKANAELVNNAIWKKLITDKKGELNNVQK